jgi:hypothetical protein
LLLVHLKVAANLKTTQLSYKIKLTRGRGSGKRFAGCSQGQHTSPTLYLTDRGQRLLNKCCLLRILYNRAREQADGLLGISFAQSIGRAVVASVSAAGARERIDQRRASHNSISAPGHLCSQSHHEQRYAMRSFLGRLSTSSLSLSLSLSTVADRTVRAATNGICRLNVRVARMDRHTTS